MATINGALDALAVTRPIKGELSDILELKGDGRTAFLNAIGGFGAIKTILEIKDRDYAMGSSYDGETVGDGGKSEQDFIDGIGATSTENITEINTLKSYGYAIEISDEVLQEKRLDTLNIEGATTIINDIFVTETDKKLDLLRQDFNFDLINGTRIPKILVGTKTSFNGILAGAKIGFDDGQAGATLTKDIVEQHIIDAQENGAMFDNGVIVAKPAIANFIWDLFKTGNTPDSREIAGVKRQIAIINNVEFALLPEKDMTAIDAVFVDFDRLKLVGNPTNGSIVSRERKPRVTETTKEVIKSYLGLNYNLSFNHSAITNFIIT